SRHELASLIRLLRVRVGLARVAGGSEADGPTDEREHGKRHAQPRRLGHVCRGEAHLGCAECHAYDGEPRVDLLPETGGDDVLEHATSFSLPYAGAGCARRD